jgi:hypothetical protein
MGALAHPGHSVTSKLRITMIAQQVPFAHGFAARYTADIHFDRPERAFVRWAAGLLT